MDLSKFWLKSNNGTVYKLENLRDLSASDVAMNPNLQKLIQLFSPDGIIQTKNDNGINEWKSIFEGLIEASDGDNILTDAEFEAYFSKKFPESGITQNDLNNLLDAAVTRQIKTSEKKTVTYYNGEINSVRLINDNGELETRTYEKINQNGQVCYKVSVLTYKSYSTYTVKDINSDGDFTKSNIINKVVYPQTSDTSIP